ncbi:MAG: molecular chaperone HtpG, partial [Bacteroidetes bacterium]
MKTGQINVQTENIFPIIKKFLYSDHEIFLRELVSNAVDASQKLKFFASNGEYKGELGELKVEVILDEENKTLTIRDNGVGMTEEEIDKYINQIAFSGAEEFVQKYKGKEGAEQIIGHFGLGFYSAFMVAEKVQIRTLSRFEGSKAVQWESNGSPEFTITEIDKADRGTDIVLFISEDSKEFLSKDRIGEILNKYCKFLPIPVIFGTKTDYIDDPNGEKDDDGKMKRVAVEIPNQINNTAPAWTKAPVDLKDEDYENFYRELYPMTFEDPLFHIHLNVDYPFNLTGILYFPRIKENVEVQRNKINLYSNQVFITDSVENIVPEFLTLLHGVIDSPDIPLNVSRSYLQSDANVKKISAHITKKVADKLAEMFKKDRADFEEKWDDLSVFVQYGMLSEDKFSDKAKTFALLKDTDGTSYTMDELKEKLGPIQTDKDNKLVLLYTGDKEAHFGFIQKAQTRGYKVLLLEGPLAPHWIQKLEMIYNDVQFARVDADTLD